MEKVADKYIIVRNLPFSVAWEVALRNGCITRESTRIRSGAAPGITFVEHEWLHIGDLIATDWMIIDNKRFFADKRKKKALRRDGFIGRTKNALEY